MNKLQIFNYLKVKYREIDGSLFSKCIYDNLAGLFCLVAFLYTCIRAYSLSIIHDEALTYLIHASGSFFEILTYALPIKSNNHLLNTFLIKIFSNLFGASEFVIRIPALIGHGLYLVGIYKILKLFLRKQFLLLGICLLIFHPFMLDLFSCARGYSLGLGFLIFGLYYSFKRIEQPGFKQDIKNTTLASIMLALSVFSNLAFLNAFFSIISILMLLEVKDLTTLIKRRQSGTLILKQFLKKILFSIIPSILLLLMIYTKPVIEMTRANEFYYGGSEGFWKNTVTSLIETTLYDRTYFDLDMLFGAKLLIIALLIFSSSVLLYKLLKRQEFKLIDRYLFWIIAALFICSLSIILQHILFNTKYVIERTAIYFVPIFLILILILWKCVRFIQNKFIRTLMDSLFYLLLFILLIHFINCANFTHFFSWKYDASTKDMMSCIIEINKGKSLEDNSIQMGVNWIFEPSINFYIIKNRLTWMKRVDRSGPDGRFDYYYLHATDKELSEKYNLTIIKKFNLSDTYLASPANPVLAACGVPATPSVAPTPLEIVSTEESVWHEGEAFLSQSGSSAADYKAAASGGQCLGMGWGSRRGDFVEYEVDLPFSLPRAVLYLRYAREGRWAAEVDVYASGKLIGTTPSLFLKPTGGWGYEADEWAYKKLLLGSMEAGRYRIKFVSLIDDGGVNIDGFFIADESFQP